MKQLKTRYVYLPNLGEEHVAIIVNADGTQDTGKIFQPILADLVNPKVECRIHALPVGGDPLSGPITGYSVEIREWVEVADAVDQ
jgi:hypothetical protein